jgi:hypothetical protein|tara:strand:+ start:523 stop:756 length:234 start_codon:yes stop_codon:yes gene_type:complete
MRLAYHRCVERKTITRRRKGFGRARDFTHQMRVDDHHRATTGVRANRDAVTNGGRLYVAHCLIRLKVESGLLGIYNQ